ncbi:MAG TPA: 4-hydroxybenzoate octaprenyltransferase [Nitrospiraceae bacterium]|nr:4-hydroxybenzoate octaprenyltransferase [Nitrospiraceae bacterium]
MAEPSGESSGSIDQSKGHANQETHLWTSLAQLIRLPNQSGTLLLMLPTLWALVLASHGRPSLALVLIFVAGSFVMRSAGVVMNDLADRSFDRRVERTRTRPLASGAVTVQQALLMVVALLIMAAGLLMLLNPLAMALSPVAVILAAIYPFAKRVLALPQAVLGIAFGWGVIMAWAAAVNSVPLPAWLLYAATICWAVAYDTIYALQDRVDDLRIGVRSSAILFDSYAWLAVGCCLVLMLLLLGVTGWLNGLNAGFYGMLAAIAGFLTQQVLLVRKAISPAQAFRLFQQHVWVGWGILAGIWLGFL